MKKHGDIGRISASATTVSFLYVRTPLAGVADTASWNAGRGGGTRTGTQRGASASVAPTMSAGRQAPPLADRVLQFGASSEPAFPDIIGTPPVIEGEPCHLLEPWFRVSVTSRERQHVKGKGDMHLFWVDPLGAASDIAPGTGPVARPRGAGHGALRLSPLTPPGAVTPVSALTPSSNRARVTSLRAASASVSESSFKVREADKVALGSPKLELSSRHRAVDKASSGARTPSTGSAPPDHRQPVVAAAPSSSAVSAVAAAVKAADAAVTSRAHVYASTEPAAAGIKHGTAAPAASISGGDIELARAPHARHRAPQPLGAQVASRPRRTSFGDILAFADTSTSVPVQPDWGRLAQGTTTEAAGFPRTS
jgi:hypothetical protein